MLATQAEAPDYLTALDALEVDATREYAALKAKVSLATDPCQGAREQLQDLARQAAGRRGRWHFMLTSTSTLLSSARKPSSSSQKISRDFTTLGPR